MSVHVLCGPARAGKTQRMLDRFRARLTDAPGSALWLGPTLRAVDSLRERLLHEAPDLRDPPLYTFHDVLQEIVRVTDPAARPLSAVQRRLLTEEIVADSSGRLTHFTAVADTRGFTDGVLALLTELVRNAVTPEQFSQKAAGLKERQCAHLYAQYLSELRRQNLHDADGTAGRACELLRRGLRAPFAKVRAVFVDGFGDFTRPQHDFLGLLCGWVEELWVALPGEPDGRRAELFARPAATLERLLELGAQIEWLESWRAGSVSDRRTSELRSLTLPARQDPPRPAGLLHLERQLFRPIRAVERSADGAGVEQIEAPGVLGEAQLVVRRIKTLLLEGTSADDILVVLRDVSPYADVLTEVLDEYAVPAEVEGTEPLTRNPAAALLLRAARLPDDDWPFAGVTALLRNTYFRPVWPEASRPDMPQRAEALLRLLGEPRGRGGVLSLVTRWAQEQQPGLEDEQAEESRRKRIHDLAIECGAFLHRFFQAWDAAPGTAPLADHADWLKRFALDIGVARGAEEDSHDYAALEQLWHEVGQWLERAEQRRGPRMDRKTFLRRLAALASESSLPRESCHGQLAARGTVRARVRVLSANQARHLEADHVFLMGLGERSFPRLTPAQSLLDEQECEALQSAGVDVGFCDLLPEEMLLFYQVAVRARRRLILSHPAVDARGQELLPSSFLLAVRDCFTPDALPVERREMLIQGFYTQTPLSEAERRIRAAAAWEAGGLNDSSLSEDLLANLRDAADLWRHRFKEAEHNPYDGRFRDPAVVAAVAQAFGPDRIFSPTALEEYVACPYRFFLHHVLRLEPLEEPSEEIQATRRGQAFHRALARLHRRLKAEGVNAPTDAVTEHVAREMAEAVDEDVRRAPSLAAKELWRLEGQRLLKQAEKYLGHWRDFVAPWPEQASPRPHEFEVDFGLPSAEGSVPHGPLVVRIDDVEVRISGRIDRVDMAELDDGAGFWIIDYKTGRGQNYTGSDLENYIRLQLTLYALAVEEVLLAGRPARPLGLAYWLVGEKGPKIVLPGKAAVKWLNDAGPWRTVRQTLRQWVASLVRHIRKGEFVLQPREDDCTQTCGFGQICRITQARGRKEGMLPLPLAAENPPSP